MGEYIKHPKTREIKKIGILDHSFYTREKLLMFKSTGWKGYYDGRYDNTLDILLNDPNTLYSFEKEIPGIDEFIINVPNRGIKHHDGCKCHDKNVISARIIGERWKDGQRRTILSCIDCDCYFTLDHVMAMFLRAKYPALKDLFNAHGEKYFPDDLAMIEILELLSTSYKFNDCSEFVELVGEEAEDIVKEWDYSSLLDFFDKCINWRSVINF